MDSTGTKQEQLPGTQTLSALHGQTIELMFLKEEIPISVLAFESKHLKTTV